MLHYAPVWCSVGRRAQEVLALLRLVEPSLDHTPAKVHELAPGIHYWKEEEGASPRAFLSLASRRFHCTVNLGDQSRIPSRSLQIHPGVLIELTTLANCYLFLLPGLVQSVALAQKTSVPQVALHELHCTLRTSLCCFAI